MIAGPYKHGSDNPEQWKDNLRVLNEYAYQVFNKGHVPIIGVNAALPVIQAAGEEHYAELMMPISLALAQRCDAVLRVGGDSAGADREVEVFRQRGVAVYYHLDDIPHA